MNRHISNRWSGMKTNTRVVFFIFCLSINLFAHETINLLTGEWPPYTSKIEMKGKMAEVIVREAFKLEGVDVKYEYYPWKRSYRSAKEGLATGTFPWYKSEQREEDFIVTKESLLKVKNVFFHLKSLDFQWKSYEDLKKYSIGGTIGYTDAALLQSKGLDVQLVPREELNLKKLLKHRMDITPSSIATAYYFINKLFTKEERSLFTYHPRAIFDSEMYMLISKNIPDAQELADSFDQGLRKLKKSGRYDQIIAEFLSQ